jgi:GT2 family glycosyltransferase
VSDVDVSVLLPCRDAEATLDEALASVRSSVGARYELVAVDHGSHDGTRALLEAAGATVVEVSREVPFADALNAGLARCAAPFIARMDADDRMHADRLAADVNALEEDDPLAAVACRAEPFPLDDTGGGMRTYIAWQNSVLTPEHHAIEIWIEQPLCHPATTFRRRALEEVGGYRHGEFPEDYDLFLRLLAAGARVRKREDVHHAWRMHAASTTRTDDARMSRDALARAKARAMVPRFDLRERPLWIAGAGKEGRRIARALIAEGVHPALFFDVAKDKVGRTRRGVPVLHADTLATRRAEQPDAFLVGGVGTSGARGVVRATLTAAGFTEGVDAVVVA